MGGNYQKGMYDQLMDVLQRLASMEAEHKEDRREIKFLTSEVNSLRHENAELLEKAAGLQDTVASLTDRNASLEHENSLLRNDAERLRRKDGNNSSNSSLPPSSDGPGTRAANTYNSRKPTKRKQGAQEGHEGRGLSKAEVEERIRTGVYKHRVRTIGSRKGPYITRYRIDLETKAVATEIRIYAGKDGKYHVPDDLKGVVTYGRNIRAIAAYLYGEGVVSNDRIAGFIRSVSGGTVSISEGSIYSYCRAFGDACKGACDRIEEGLLDSPEVCTDATVVSTNGRQTYIRNFSTEDSVLYIGTGSKKLEVLKGIRVLREYAGRLMHDHETAMYHFGTEHAECNVHLGRYLVKNTEETGNRWSHDLEMLLLSTEATRKKLKAAGVTGFSEAQLKRISGRYDEIIATGLKANESTKGRLARKEEKALLKRLRKHKREHLLYIYDFSVHYSNNMSEKDLRICKNREKMAGGFRTAEGRTMYCRIMSVMETMKRRGIELFYGITELMAGRPVIN